MAFKPGISGNKNGKPKGAQNRTTKEAKELLESVLYGEIDNIKSSLGKIKEDSDYRYIDALNKLFSYVIPKKTDITTDNEPIKQDLNIIVDSSDTAEALKRLRNESKPN